MTQRIIQRDYYHPTYPKQICHNHHCGTNIKHKGLPELDCEGNPWPWSYTAAGPTTMKHIYTGIPNYFPPQMISRPLNTMYGNEFQQTDDVYGKRQSYHWKAYPFTHKHIREKRVYSSQILPYMSVSNWTRYPIEGRQ